MKKFLPILLIIIASIAVPSVASAACAVVPQTFSDVICIFISLLSNVIPIIVSLALVVFVWGLAKFILHAGDEKAREEGKEIMKWGIIALFVLVSVEGIILFIHGDIFGSTPRGLPLLPVR